MMQNWIRDNAITIPCIMESKVITSTIHNKLTELFNKVIEIDKTVLNIDFYAGNTTARDIEVLNIKLADYKIEVLSLKKKYNTTKSDINTVLKNIKKYSTQLFKDEIKDFKYVTEKTDYIENAITEGINSAIGNSIIEEHNAAPTTIAEAESGVTKSIFVINPKNIVWDIKDQLDKLASEFDNIMSIIDTLTFTIKGIRELLMKEN